MKLTIRTNGLIFYRTDLFFALHENSKLIHTPLIGRSYNSFLNRMWDNVNIIEQDIKINYETLDK